MMEICQENSPEYAALFAYYEKLAAVLADKADLGVRMKAAYDKKQLLVLKEICEKEITSNELEMYRDDGTIYRKRLGLSPDKLQIVKI